MKPTADTRRPSVGPRRFFAVVILGLLLVFPGAAGAEQLSIDSAAQVFLDVCSGCHTIGDGELVGPDLLDATEWSREDLRTEVQRMEEDYIDPLTPEQIDGVVEFLLAPGRDEILARIADSLMEEAQAALNPASPDTGRSLFFGTVAFENRATPCFACHSVGGSGGNLAADLTTVVSRMSEPAILSVTETPNFPMMKAAYLNRPVTPQEALDLASFFKASAEDVEAGAVQLPGETNRLYGAAGGFVALVLLMVALTLHGRRAGVRRRLVRDSSRRLLT